MISMKEELLAIDLKKFSRFDWEAQLKQDAPDTKEEGSYFIP
jgi:hypothetical protein